MHTTKNFHWALVKGTDDGNSRRSMGTRRPAAEPYMVAMVRNPDDGPGFCGYGGLWGGGKDDMEYYVRFSIMYTVNMQTFWQQTIAGFLPVAKFLSPVRKQQVDMVTVKGFTTIEPLDRKTADTWTALQNILISDCAHESV